ncbi:integrating conjugative element protein, partial [Pseudomonas aeruginosa]
MIPLHMKASVRSSRRRGIAPLAGLLALATTLALAQNGGFQYTGSVIGDEVMYSIGGGNAV